MKQQAIKNPDLPLDEFKKLKSNNMIKVLPTLPTCRNTFGKTRTPALNQSNL
jgi:hypothetical protein